MISTLMHTAVDVAKVRNMIKFADVKEMYQDKFYPWPSKRLHLLEVGNQGILVR
jgi:hypothetical protein